MMKTNRNDKRSERKWLRRMAELEDRHPSISVGGLAADLGLLHSSDPPAGLAFGRLINLARRKLGLSIEVLADKADVELSELLLIERGEDIKPSPRTVYRLAGVLKFSVGKLMELAGLAIPREPELGRAALRFAARSEPTTELTKEEREAYEEFAKALAESND
jgi:transcriptional regulator with XRE-family HTH domain